MDLAAYLENLSESLAAPGGGASLRQLTTGQPWELGCDAFYRDLQESAKAEIEGKPRAFTDEADAFGSGLVAALSVIDSADPGDLQRAANAFGDVTTFVQRIGLNQMNRIFAAMQDEVGSARERSAFWRQDRFAKAVLTPRSREELVSGTMPNRRYHHFDPLIHALELARIAPLPDPQVVQTPPPRMQEPSKQWPLKLVLYLLIAAVLAALMGTVGKRLWRRRLLASEDPGDGGRAEPGDVWSRTGPGGGLQQEGQEGSLQALVEALGAEIKNLMSDLVTARSQAEEATEKAREASEEAARALAGLQTRAAPLASPTASSVAPEVEDRLGRLEREVEVHAGALSSPTTLPLAQMVAMEGRGLAQQVSRALLVARQAGFIPLEAEDRRKLRVWHRILGGTELRWLGSSIEEWSRELGHLAALIEASALFESLETRSRQAEDQAREDLAREQDHQDLRQALDQLTQLREALGRCRNRPNLADWQMGFLHLALRMLESRGLDPDADSARSATLLRLCAEIADDALAHARRKLDAVSATLATEPAEGGGSDGE